MRRSFVVIPLVGMLALAVAGPAAAGSPVLQSVQFTTDPYVVAECDGYDVMEQDNISINVQLFFDQTGAFLREVDHATDTGVIWRSDTGAQIATYSDAGGTFTAAANNVFTWTGVHNSWTLTDGTTYRDVGRVVVAEVAPGDFERIFGAGMYPEIDPCSW